jgi:hypothetical protein
VIKRVEELADIQIQNPVITPATLPCFCNGIERRTTRPVPIGIIMEEWFHNWLELSFHYSLRDPILNVRYAKLLSRSLIHKPRLDSTRIISFRSC